MNWYFEGRDDRWQLSDASDAEGCIAEGRRYHDDGAPFQIAQGRPYESWSELFSDWRDLADHIDGLNEDNSYEEGFTEEAGLGKRELQPLLDEINAAWSAFIEKHKPTSCKLNLSGYVDVPGTDEWAARQVSPSPAGGGDE